MSDSRSKRIIKPNSKYDDYDTSGHHTGSATVDQEAKDVVQSVQQPQPRDAGPGTNDGAKEQTLTSTVNVNDIGDSRAILDHVLNSENSNNVTVENSVVIKNSVIAAMPQDKGAMGGTVPHSIAQYSGITNPIDIISNSMDGMKDDEVIKCRFKISDNMSRDQIREMLHNETVTQALELGDKTATDQNPSFIAQMTDKAKESLEKAINTSENSVNAGQLLQGLHGILNLIKYLDESSMVHRIDSVEMANSGISFAKQTGQTFNSLFSILDQSQLDKFISSEYDENNGLMKAALRYQEDKKIALNEDNKQTNSSVVPNLSGNVRNHEEYPPLAGAGLRSATAPATTTTAKTDASQANANMSSYANAARAPGEITPIRQTPQMDANEIELQRIYDNVRRAAAQELQRRNMELQRIKLDKEKREKNIIIKGLHETNQDGDREAIKRIFSYLGCSRRLNEIEKIERIGNKGGRRRCRLVIVKFSTASGPFELVNKAPSLAFDSLLGGLYIQNDLSREERSEAYNNRRFRHQGPTDQSWGGQPPAPTTRPPMEGRTLPPTAPPRMTTSDIGAQGSQGPLENGPVIPEGNNNGNGQVSSGRRTVLDRDQDTFSHNLAANASNNRSQELMSSNNGRNGGSGDCGVGGGGARIKTNTANQDLTAPETSSTSSTASTTNISESNSNFNIVGHTGGE